MTEIFFFAGCFKLCNEKFSKLQKHDVPIKQTISFSEKLNCIILRMSHFREIDVIFFYVPGGNFNNNF